MRGWPGEAYSVMMRVRTTSTGLVTSDVMNPENMLAQKWVRKLSLKARESIRKCLLSSYDAICALVSSDARITVVPTPL